METRIRIASPFGTSFQTVPHFLSAQPVWPFRDKSTLSIHYPEMGVKSKLLNGECEVIFEYYNGTSWVEPKDSRFMTGGGSHDRLEQTPTKRYDFAALLPAMLERAHVWEAAGLPTDTDGNILFGAATPGTIMRTLFNNAKSRGWGTALSLDFTATHDSNGQAWAGGINLALDPAQTLYDVISALGNQGIVDWCGQGRTLQMFNPDTALGRDLPAVRLFAAHGETSAPEQISHRDRATVLRVVGDEGLKWDRANGTSPWGRLEAIMSAGGVSDEGTAYLMSDEELLKASGARISRTREFDGSSKFLPHRDFRGGDHVRYQTENGLESMRVFSMSLTIEERTTGYAVLGDRFEDALIRAARNQQKLTVGKINGGNGKQPTQPSDDVRTPEYPFGFVMSSSAYLDPIGEEVGRVHAGWSHTGKATDGTEIDIDRFEFRIRESGLGDDQWQSFRSVHGEDRNAVFSPVRVRREDGSQEMYDFAIRAVSAASRVSRWIYYRNLIMEPDMVPPPVPSMPIGEAVYGVIIIQWDGLGEGDEPMPPDFIHTEAEIGTSPEGPWQFVNNYERAGAVPVPFKLPYGTYWMRLRSVDRVGNKSEWSALGEVTSTPLVDLPDVHDMIDDINTQIEGVRESANGANRRIDSTEDPSVDGKERDGDSWWKWTVAPHVADPKILLGQWTWMVDKWEPMEMGHQVLASIDLGKATVGMLDGIFIKAKTLNAGHIIVGDFTNLATLDPDRGINVTQPAGFLTEIVGDYAKKAAGGSDSLMFMDQTGPVPIESEDWVRISFVATASSSVGVTARVSVYPNVMGSTGVVSGSTPVSIEVGTNTYSVDVQIPSLDAISGGKSWIAGLVGSGIRSLQVRNVRVYKKSNATLIGPDSIRTPHLGADIIEGHHIKANTIETDNLVGGFADFIVMTGSLVQTVAQANRGIKLSGDSNNMQGWNSSGQRVVLIDANSGNVFLGKNEAIKMYGASGNIVIGNDDLVFDAATGNLTIQGEFATSPSGRRARLSDTNLTAALNVYADNTSARGAVYAAKPETSNMVQTVYRFHSASSTGTDYEFQYAMTENTWRIGTMTTDHFIGHGPTGSPTTGTYVESPVILNRPYTLTANMVITSNGIIGIASSASRYKLDQRTMKLSDDLLNIPVKDWYDKTESEESDQLGELGVRTEPQQRIFETRTRTPGVVAEDVADVEGGESFVIRDLDGQTQGVAYDRLALAQIQVLARRVAELEKLLT